MPFHRLLILFFTLLVIRPLDSQNYLPPEYLSVEKGLPSSHVNGFAFDKRGFLWVGTPAGLNRFDGTRFIQPFTRSDGQHSLADQPVVAVKPDADGNIWFLTRAGLIKYSWRTGVVYQVPQLKADSLAQSGNGLLDIAPAPDGGLWLASSRQLMVVHTDGRSETWDLPQRADGKSWQPSCLTFDAGGILWIGTNSGILFFDTKQQTFTELLPAGSREKLANARINCLYYDRDNSMWIGTGNGLNRFDPVDSRYETVLLAGKESSGAGLSVSALCQSPDGALFAATPGAIYMLAADGGNTQRVAELAGIPVTFMISDSSGTLWGATGEGLLKIRRSQLPVSHYTNTATPKLISPGEITGISLLADRIMLAYKGGYYDALNLRTREKQGYKTLNGGRVVGFYALSENRLAVLSENNLEITGGNSRKSVYDIYSWVKKDQLQQAVFTCLLFDSLSGFWLGTEDGLQLIRTDSAKHRVIRSLRFENQDLRIGRVYDIESDEKHNIWIATNDGLIYYNPQRGDLYRYTPYDQQLLNTEHKEVYTIERVNGDLFWIGTSKGVYRFDVPDRQFTLEPRDPAVSEAPVRSLGVDRQKNVWMAAGRGLYVFNPHSGTTRYFDQHEGLLNQVVEFIQTIPDGSVCLAGKQGLSVIGPEGLQAVRGAYRVIISSLRMVSEEPGSDRVYYNLGDTVVIPWKRNPVRIDFVLADMGRPDFARYRYSMGKVRRDPDWHNLGNQNYVLFGHLSPGKYRFLVTASTSEMPDDNEITSMLIIVEASSWRSTKAIIIYAAIGAVILLILLRLLVRQFFSLSRENQEKEMYALQIMLQKEELTLKNKSITDSINYAKRIQTAMLPPVRLFRSIFPSSFVLYMPKDIVSGDFYWINKLDDRIFIAAVDCTGHGVPGAFMSIIGFELFRKITNIEGLTRPSDILNRLNEDFHVIFKDVDNVVLRDGMDVAFCSIDKTNMILEFAGAFNPLYLIRDNKITEIKGDRFAIGLDETNFKDQTFKNHLIPIQQGDIIYIFSDGFADQFGGPDGKKYKYRRFRHLLLNLHQLPMEKQHEILENNVLEWRGEQEQVDDILVIGIKIDF